MSLPKADSARAFPSQHKSQIEAALDRFLPSVQTQPEGLHRAIRYAVFGDGKRLRPQLLLHVAHACAGGNVDLDLAVRAACAVELIHIASLVHDDLPCFDNAQSRRGRPTVHVLFGEARALLVGDALLALSFELLTTGPSSSASRALRIGQLLARATGSTSGLVAGQAQEHAQLGLDPALEGAESYHVMKTGALFAMAAEAGAVSVGSRKAAAWARVGLNVGRGYQIAYALESLRAVGSAAAAPDVSDTKNRAPLQPQVALRRQLKRLCDALHEQIQALAVDPAPLLQFLDGLCSPFLESQSASVPLEPGKAAAVTFPDPGLLVET